VVEPAGGIAPSCSRAASVRSGRESVRCASRKFTVPWTAIDLCHKTADGGCRCSHGATRTQAI